MANEKQQPVTTISIEKYPAVKSKLTTLAKKYANLVVTEETLEEAKKARLELRENRYEIQNIQKNNRKILNDAKKTMDEDAESLISIIRPTEDEIDGKIKAIEEKKERERLARIAEMERLNKERQDKITKLQNDFTARTFQIQTVDEFDTLIKDIDTVNVTQEEFGDLAIVAANMVSSLKYNANNAKNILVQRIQAEKEREIQRYKDEYFLVDGKKWEGEDDAETIKYCIGVAKERKLREFQEQTYISVFLEIPDPSWTTTEIQEKTSTRLKELAEAARKQAEEKLIQDKAAETKNKLVQSDLGEKVEELINEDEITKFYSEPVQKRDDSNVTERKDFKNEQDLLEDAELEKEKATVLKHFNYHLMEVPAIKNKELTKLVQRFSNDIAKIVNEYIEILNS